jgi:hypothetical protein
VHPSLHTLLRRCALLAAVTAVAVFAAAGTAGAGQYHGAQLHALWGGVSVADYDHELDLLAEAGADSVRIDMGWSSLESDGKGKINDWYAGRVDTFMAHARARGMKVIVALVNSPCWASSAPESAKAGCTGQWWDRGVEVYAPTNPQDYADAAAYVAKRWQADLAALEIWNEPNDNAYFRSNDVVADYAAIVKASYAPIKAAAPDVPVIAGVVANSDRDFLERLYAAGIAGHYDGLSIHPYNEWRDPDDAWQPQYKAYSFLSGVKWVRDLMVAHGDSDKGLWLTEFGFSTCGTGDKVCVTPEQQAQYTKDSFKIAAGWSYVRAAMVYNLRNIGDTPNSRLEQYGLVRRDWSKKPAYEALKQALHEYYGPNAAPQPDPDAATAGADTGTSGGGRTGTASPVTGGFVSVVGGPQGAVLTTTASGVTRVKLTCKAKRARRCRGQLKLRTPRSRGAVARKRFSIRPGTTSVRLQLSQSARREIARVGRLRVTASVAAIGPGPQAKAVKRSFVLSRSTS